MAKACGRTILFLAVVALCAGLALGVCAIVRCLDPFEGRPFDSAAWAAADVDGRAAMARGAIRCLPAGMPEAKIEALLGKTDVEETVRLTASRPPGAVRTYSYYLGCWSGIYYDSTYLWVHVDTEGRVIAAVIGGG
jgi:hypothetical protein